MQISCLACWNEVVFCQNGSVQYYQQNTRVMQMTRFLRKKYETLLSPYSLEV